MIQHRRNLHDNYWSIGGDNSKYYSSSASSMVSVSDPKFVFWNKGYDPINISSWEDLFEVLASHNLVNEQVLDLFLSKTNKLRNELVLEIFLKLGITVKSANTPLAGNTYDLSLGSQRRINMIVTNINAGKHSDTVCLKDKYGQSQTFSAVDFVRFSELVNEYISDLYLTESKLNNLEKANWPSRILKI